MKRVLSLLLAVCMVISMVPSMFAEEPAAEPEEEIIVASEPEVVEEVTAEPETAPAEEPTEAAEPEVVETEAAEEVTEEVTEEAAEEVIEEAGEIAEEATEAPEEETAEAAEEVTEETEVPEETEEPDAVEKGTWWFMPKDALIRQVANNKVTISWASYIEGTDMPASYVVGEYIGGKYVKRGFTTGKSVTISNVAYGAHNYYLYPCRSAKGNLADCDKNTVSLYSITTAKQPWRSAPKAKVIQDPWHEGTVRVTVPNCDAAMYLFELDAGFGIEYHLYDLSSNIWVNISSAGLDSLLPDITSKSIGSTPGAKGKLSDSKWFTFGYDVDPVRYSFSVKVRVYGIGQANDKGFLDRGNPSAKKTVTLKPQWTKAPKFFRVELHTETAYGTEQPWVWLDWDYYGSPTSFDVYDCGEKVLNIPMGSVKEHYTCRVYSQNFDSSWATIKVPVQAGGKHNFKVVPVYEYKGKNLQGSAAKTSITVNLPWLTVKPTVTLSQPSENTVKLDWNSLDGAKGYEIYEIVKEGKQTTKKYITFTSKNTYTVKGLSLGSHSFVVRPYGWQTIPAGFYGSTKADEIEIYGAFSAKKAIKVKELWKSAPKNVTVEVVNSALNAIRINWEAPGAPDCYIVKVMKGKKPVFEIKEYASATSPRSTECNLPNSGTYTISVRAMKNDVYSPWSSAKKFVYAP